jgi:uncharacterized protein (TIGR02453 family)
MTPTSPAPFTGFPPGTRRFLRALARNNTREWFEAHREQYEQDLRTPMRAFISAIDDRLGTQAPEIIGDARSLFRIHRDVRFSPDKRPYKTNAACWFYHRDAGRAVGAEAAHGGAGFYFHISADEAFLGGGVWLPPSSVLGRIRDAIAEAPEDFEAVVTAPAFKRRFGTLESEHRLKTIPRGYDRAHPAAEWLRLRSFTAGRTIPVESLGSPRLVAAVMRDFVVLLPLVRWLNAVSGLRPATSRGA